MTEPAPTLSKSSAESLALGWIAPDCELIRYSFSLDDKNWYEISKVYTEDVGIYYPEPVGPIAGLANVMVVMETMLESMLTPVLIDHTEHEHHELRHGYGQNLWSASTL